MDRISSGEAFVVKSRSWVVRSQQRVAHRAADDGQIEPGILERRREGADDRILGERTETGEAVSHVEHGFQRTGADAPDPATPVHLPVARRPTPGHPSSMGWRGIVRLRTETPTLKD